MNYATKKWLRQIGIIFLIAAVVTALPRIIAASFMLVTRLAMTIAMIWILYKFLKPIVIPYVQRNLPNAKWPKQRLRKGRSHLRIVKKDDLDDGPPNRYSDRR